MLILSVLRYILGYINFKACGGFADRFINLCTKQGISLWNVQNIGGEIYASTTLKGYLSIRSAAKKSGMRVRCIEKKGLLFFLKNHKARVGILIGIIVSALIIAVLSQFVWSVSVVGNMTLDDDYILSEFEKEGVRVGVLSSKIDNKSAVQNVMSKIEKLSWASVNMKGSVVVIEVREKTDAPKMYDASKPTNVVASDDGVILSVDVLYGIEEVKPGSAVTKGDLLISGIVTHKDGTENVIHADGYVKALVKKQQYFSPNDFSVFALNNEKKRSLLFFFGVKIPLGPKCDGQFFTEHNSFVQNGETMMPLGIITQYSASYNEDEAELNEASKEKIALYKNAVFVKETLNYSDIKSSSVAKIELENGVQFSFSAECEQEIGNLVEIYVEKTDDIQ